MRAVLDRARERWTDASVSDGDVLPADADRSFSSPHGCRCVIVPLTDARTTPTPEQLLDAARVVVDLCAAPLLVAGWVAITTAAMLLDLSDGRFVALVFAWTLLGAQGWCGAIRVVAKRQQRKAGV